MKHLKLFFACLLMAVLSIGQVWAAEELKATIDFSSNDFSIPTSKTVAENTYTHDGISMTLTGTSGNGYAYYSKDKYLLNGKQGATITFSAFEWKTTKIVVTGRSGASGSTKMNIFVGENAVSTETTGCTGTNTYNIASTSQAAGTIYTLKVTSAHNAQFTKFEIYGEDAGTPAKTLTGVTVSGAPTKTSYYAGDNFDPAGLTVTGTYSDKSTAPITSGITWAYNPSQELALNQTSIGVTATVSEITSAEYPVSITVSEAPAAATYEKVTSTENITDGDYLIVYEDGNVALNGALTSLDAVGNTVAVTINDGVITGSVAIDAATVTINTTAKTIQTASGYYIGVTSYSNGLSSSTSNAYEHQNISIDGGNAVIYFQQESWNSNKNGKMQLCYNSGSDQRRFRYFKEGSQKAIQLYKKVDGTVKPSAELSYAAADQKKLTKLGETFTAPTLVNPHTVAVTYASNNTDVAEVASNGAVTIKAAGVATITASYDGSGDYKEGSASYTIGVTSHAGTEADPYVAADVKIAIDVKGTVENAYASGIVSNVVTTSLPAEGYISFYFSADGLTSGQQVEAYKCFGLNSAQFEAVSDVVTGATVIVTGNLKKFNSTYEFDQNCHLVSYTAPAAAKTPIANTKETAYTVAQAITYAADGVTYDLDDYVYVSGVVYDVKSFNTTNGTLDIYIKDAGQENQFELFKCAGINDGSATTPFEALTDVQEGDEVIAYGQLTVYNAMSELKSGNYLVELTRPEVAVSSVTMTESTAEVEVGSTVTLHASVLPENATNKTITWSVQSGSDYASVDAGVVTGNAEGEAVIRAASTADPTKYAECTVTVNAADPTKHVVTFDATVDKTTEATELSITKGDLTIAVTEGDGRFNNGTDYRPYKNAVFTVSCSSGNITKIEFTCTSSKPITGFADLEGLDKTNEVWTGNAPSVSFTASGAQVQMTQLVITYKEDNRAAAGLAWDPSDDIELTVGDAFTAPTLSNPNNIDAAEITVASDNTELATVSAGVVSLVENATGEATITATFAGNDDYKPTVVSYTITVNAAAPVPLTDYYEKVTETAGIVEGTYLIVYEDGDNSLAFNGGLETLDAESNTIAVTITTDNKIGVTEQTAAATFYIDPAAGTVKSASNHYIGVSSWSNGLKQTDTYVHNVLEIDGDGNAQIGIYKADWNTTGGTMRLQYNKGAGQTRFRYFKNGGQQSIALYKLHNEVIKPEAGLAWDPSDDIELTVGDAFTAPTLLNPNNIDAAEITIASSNTDVATVTAGVVALVADATGTTTITATFAGNASYKPATVSYKIKVNPAHSIYVSPSLNVNFGSVAKDATVDDKVITVTLTGVDAATATLEGAGASAFEFTPAALTASGDITISASSATAGTFVATLTISDDASVAASKVVNLSLTVTDPAAEETPISTSTKWVAATAADLVDGAEVIITGVKDEVVYAMGEQKSTNRAAYVASVDGEGVLTPGDGTMAFTLVAQETEGVFALRTSDGKYLYAAASGSNHLKTQDNVDVNAQWTLTIASAVATGSSNRNVMQFNGSGTNKLFACYASDSQEDIQFYVPKPVTPPTPLYETVRSGLEAGRHYTVCLEKKVTAVKGATFWSLTYKNSENTAAYLVQEEAPFTAGKPYIIQATDDNEGKLEVVYEGDAAGAPVENGALRGTFSYMDADALAAVEGTVYMLFNNELCPIGTNNHLDAHRAYVLYNLLTVPSGPNFAPGKKVKSMPLQKDVTTGFENLNASEKPVKLMIDGNIYILRGEKLYDATGRLVK